MFNNLQGRTGTLFEERFKRKHITDDKYLKDFVCYINNNPVKHNFVKDTKDYYRTSYHSHISKKDTNVKRDIVIDMFDDVDNFKYVNATKSNFDDIEDFLFEEN